MHIVVALYLVLAALIVGIPSSLFFALAAWDLLWHWDRYTNDIPLLLIAFVVGLLILSLAIFTLVMIVPNLNLTIQ